MRKMSNKNKIIWAIILLISISFTLFRSLGLNDYTIGHELRNIFGYEQVTDFRYSRGDFKVAYAKVTINDYDKLDTILKTRTLYSELSRKFNILKRVDNISIDFVDFTGAPVARTSVKTEVLYGTEWEKITKTEELIKQASIKFK